MKEHKIDLNYYLVLEKLDNLLNLVIEDEEYKRRFRALYNYVEEKVDVPIGYEIVDIYVTNVIKKVASMNSINQAENRGNDFKSK